MFSALTTNRAEIFLHPLGRRESPRLQGLENTLVTKLTAKTAVSKCRFLCFRHSKKCLRIAPHARKRALGAEHLQLGWPRPRSVFNYSFLSKARGWHCMEILMGGKETRISAVVMAPKTGENNLSCSFLSNFHDINRGSQLITKFAPDNGDRYRNQDDMFMLQFVQ